MDTRGTGLTIVGVVVGLLGALWTVQGLGLVQAGPILCVADCEPVTGGSARWTAVGAAAVLVGLAIVRVGPGRVNR